MNFYFQSIINIVLLLAISNIAFGGMAKVQDINEPSKETIKFDGMWVMETGSKAFTFVVIQVVDKTVSIIGSDIGSEGEALSLWKAEGRYIEDQKKLIVVGQGKDNNGNIFVVKSTFLLKDGSLEESYDVSFDTLVEARKGQVKYQRDEIANSKIELTR